MFRTFGRSWQLFKASLAILRQDKELLVFPLISALGLIVVSILFFIPLAASGIFNSASNGGTGSQIISVVVGFLFYWITYTVVIFSQTALVGAAMIRLNGGDPTVKDGFRIASERLGKIIGYASIAATVGMILNAIQNSARSSDNIVVSIIGQIFAGILNMAWNLITFLVVPVLVVENVGPIEAIKRSGSYLKKTWGENLVATAGMGFISFLFMLAGFLVVGALTFLLSNIMGGAGVVIGMVLMVAVLGTIGLFFSALGGIFQAALYKYATEGTTGDQFEPSLITEAFATK
ncbi:MAG: DUF6159 family protein [Phototrophicales bacterium]|jgi:hypothetical protein|nr:DUF6159 family protein [Phototrophicales bacterium]